MTERTLLVRLSNAETAAVAMNAMYVAGLSSRTVRTLLQVEQLEQNTWRHLMYV